VIGICTDSGSQLPASLAARLGIEVVPLTVTVGGREFLEGIDLDVDQLYAMFADEGDELTVAQPSPGQCAVAYEALAERGCSSIVSIHSSLADCNALHAARLATRSAPVPVRIVDCGSVSFGVGCCAWAAADAALGGASVEGVVEMLDTLVANVDHVFAINPAAPDVGIYVASGIGEGVDAITCALTTAHAVEAMAGHVLGRAGALRIGVGAGAREALPLADELELALRAVGRPIELIRYRIGAGMAQRMRPGTVGCFAFPAG
jgi:hypothetical protein